VFFFSGNTRCQSYVIGGPIGVSGIPDSKSQNFGTQLKSEISKLGVL